MTTSKKVKPTIHTMQAEARDIVSQRGELYDGDADGTERSFKRIAAMFNGMKGEHWVTASDVALILTCQKMVRFDQSPDHKDSAIDGSNYLLFAAEEAANADS